MKLKKVRNLAITIIIMFFVSAVSLFIVSILSYLYKWQADKALIGITVTYIFAGFAGGFTQRLLEKSEKGMGRKMIEAILLSVLFMLLLLLLSFFVIQNPFVLSSRFFMIFMLLTGSASLGRIL